jgi:hypothetical protein
MAQGGGDIHIHMGDVHALDARGVDQILMQRAGTIAAIIRQQRREFRS